MTKLDHKKLAAKYWDMLHPHTNFYALKPAQIQNQYDTMKKFLEILEDMEKISETTGINDVGPGVTAGGFYDGNSNLVSAGDRVEHIDGRKATLINALQDGDADVKFENGTYGLVKWRNLCKI